MGSNELRRQIGRFLSFEVVEAEVPFAAKDRVEEDGYCRLPISYAGAEGDRIPAFLLLPEGDGPFAAVLVHHQHHGQRHLGKSEVCGLAGDPLQAFGPALARRGIVVLAPDSVCFEDRRHGQSGTEPHALDVAQHFDEMCFRLLRGDTLMRKVLDDSARAISLLRQHPQVDSARIGIMGHSYGGNTVLFHAPLDERIAFACSSGAACSFAYKMSHHVGIEMAEAIPGFASRFDVWDLVSCTAPRPMLLVSATEDKHSMDAPAIVEKARGAYEALGQWKRLEHARYVGEHEVTQERFDAIVQWLATRASEQPTWA